MEKSFHCWHCDEKQSSLKCSQCGTASYCSPKCRDSDIFRHKVECANAAKVLKCNNCGRHNNELKACTVCYSAFYCNKDCQTRAWKSHKVQCEGIAEEIFSIAAERYQLPSYSELPSYVGSSIAENYLCLEDNEGAGTDQTLKLLFIGVGDIRNVVCTVASLPSNFDGKLKFVLDDISPHTMARNLLFLYISIVYPTSVCDLVQIWYSMGLTLASKHLLTTILEELTSQRRQALLGKMRHLVSISEKHWQLCINIWQGWLRLNSLGIFASLRLVQERALKLLHYCEKIGNLCAIVPRQHLSSLQIFMRDGRFLPEFSSQREIAIFVNPTLAHFNPFNSACKSKYQDINSVNPFVNGWGFEFSEDAEMIYGVEGDCYVFACWDYLEVKKVAGMKDDLMQMYCSYLETVFGKFIKQVQKGNVTFQLIIDGFDKMQHYLSDDERFDRIALSSLADYYYIPVLLQQFGPLLNKDNKHAVLISKHVKWHEYTHLSNDINFENCVSEVSTATFDMLARPDVLPNVAYFCARPEEFAQHLVNSYFNTYPHFLKSLLAEVILYLHKTKGSPLSKPALKKVLRFEQAFGLKMRDYCRQTNHVIPFYRESISRRVALKPNTTRYLEWKAL